MPKKRPIAPMLKRISTLGYAAALATAPAWVTACSSQSSAEAQDPSVLFSLSSDAMHFENPSGMNVTLVMDGVDPDTVWFTDRPTRDSGAITTGQLAREWADSGALGRHGDKHDHAWPAQAGAVSLFIDSVSLNAVTTSPTPSPTAAPHVSGSTAASPSATTASLPPRPTPTYSSHSGITLCTSPSSCNSSGSQNYTYNTTIYFTTNITENVT